jgi:predicted nucleotide-binding protein (sugar kinase/HSP70/actin superfamily)
VRERKIGEVVYFQGGTAYNDAVAAAFSKVLDKPIIVPPHNGVVGAIGMALLAQEKAEATDEPSSFRGWDIEKIDYTLRKFSCKACSNVCDMEEFTVDGVKTYWGDKCSERYRRRARVEREPVVSDLVKLKRGWLEEFYENRRSAGAPVKVGVPRAMYYFDQYPFWATWLDELGVDVVLSDKTNRGISNAGQDHTVAEPCYPITVAHGHIHQLIEKDPDFILLPNVINAEATDDQMESYLCPWGQNLPFLARSAAGLEQARERMLVPNVRFREGESHVKKSLRETAQALGAKGRDNDRAVTKALAVQRDFYARVLDEGRRAMRAIADAGREGILLLGRPYNIYDDGVNMGIPAKLRDFYGVNVVPLDFLDVSGENVADLHPNMFWSYGRRILAAAKLSARLPHLHLIYITNFKCGPDSFIKQFVKEGSGRPYLTLQFDGHANDAGALTRCEAYLDSKGVLRWWSREAATAASAPQAKSRTASA